MKANEVICKICGRKNNRKDKHERRKMGPIFYLASGLAYVGYDSEQGGHFYVSERRINIRRLDDAELLRR